MRILSFLILSLILSSCAGTRPGYPGIDFSSYPKDWPGLSEQVVADEYCYEIESTFLSRGQSNSTLSDWFENPIYERNSLGKHEIASKNNFFSVRSDAQKKILNIDVFDTNGNLLASGLHKQFDRCENGWFVQESFITGGSGDNPVRSTYGTMVYGLAQDGSLLIYSYQEVVSGKFLVGSETKESSIWFKYQVQE